MTLESILSTIGWATLAVVIGQAVSIGLMAWLGLSPRKLVTEIEDVQNTAVGAMFFVISLVTTLFVSPLASSGFTPDETVGQELMWIVFGVLLALALTAILFIVAHNVMGRHENETIYHYMQREIILEQNAAVALFLGGLMVNPFVAVVFQLI